MADGKIGIWTGFLRWITFYNWRKGRQIADGADAQFSGSVQGIKHGFEMHNDALVVRYRDLRDAIGTFETALETKRTRAAELGKKIEAKEKTLNGALAVIERAQASKNTTEEAQARSDAAQFQKDLKALHAELDSIEEQLKGAEGRRTTLIRQLQDLKKEIENLGTEQADAIADFISNKQLLETLDRLDGLTTTIDRGPIDAIRKANQDLAARTRVAERMHEATSTDRDKVYAEAGDAQTADDDISAMLAQRAAKRAEKTGEGDKPAQERDKI